MRPIRSAGSISLTALLFLGANASGQPLHLSANQSYSYEFQTLPLNNDFHLGVPGRYGYFGLTLGGDLLTAGESARMDYFESSLSDPPTASVMLIGTNLPFSGILISQPNLWQDLQGGVRVTVLHGAIDLANIEVAVVRDFDVYGQTVAVPEPSALGLLTVGLLAAVSASVLRRLGLAGSDRNIRHFIPK